MTSPGRGLGTGTWPAEPWSISLPTGPFGTTDATMPVLRGPAAKAVGFL
jgi:hypothetical protein